MAYRYLGLFLLFFLHAPKVLGGLVISSSRRFLEIKKFLRWHTRLGDKREQGNGFVKQHRPF